MSHPEAAYPRDREAEIALRDGSTVHVRLVRPADEQAIRKFLEELSPELALCPRPPREVCTALGAPPQVLIEPSLLERGRRGNGDVRLGCHGGHDTPGGPVRETALRCSAKRGPAQVICGFAPISWGLDWSTASALRAGLAEALAVAGAVVALPRLRGDGGLRRARGLTDLVIDY